MDSILSISAQMKTIGIIGGSTDVATAEYYKLINASVKRRLGGYHTAKIIINSMDVATSVYFVKTEKWDEGAEHLRKMVVSLERAGADFIICVSNTWHRCVEAFMVGANIPLLHIGDATAQAIKAKARKKVALLGTYVTMSGTHLRARLSDLHGLEVLVPTEEQQREIDRVIFEELTFFNFTELSKQYYLNVIDDLHAHGAEGTILGCTEISLLVKQEDRPDLPLFDTLAIHAEAAAELAVSNVRR